MTDDELIVWVANAHPGQAMPARMGVVDVVDRLVPHGCPAPTPGEPMATVVSRVQDWARGYLERQQ